MNNQWESDFLSAISGQNITRTKLTRFGKCPILAEAFAKPFDADGQTRIFKNDGGKMVSRILQFCPRGRARLVTMEQQAEAEAPARMARASSERTEVKTYRMRKGAAVLVCLALGGLSACQKSFENSDTKELAGTTANGIVNGQTVSGAQTFAREVVALVRTGAEGQALCTATIVSDSLALTAAHCLDDQPDQLAIVFATDLQNASADNIRTVDRFIQNPAWKGDKSSADSSKGRSDLGLVHFSGGLPDGYSAMKLVTSDAGDAGTDLWVVGFGIDDPQNKTGEGLLRKVQTDIVQTLNDTEVLLSGEDGGVCFGDSGGPAVLSGKLFAVASAVTSELCDSNSVHTKVAPFANWIAAAGDKLDGR